MVIPGSSQQTLWSNIFNLTDSQTMRDFVRSQEDNIQYVLVDTPTIFADLDTPEEYQREKPAWLMVYNTNQWR